jgi:RHS repeat-associated protein
MARKARRADVRLLYAEARYYDPALGQFLTHDPAMQFASPYALGPGDPVNTADPTGAEAEGREVDQAQDEGNAGDKVTCRLSSDQPSLGNGFWLLG